MSRARADSDGIEGLAAEARVRQTAAELGVADFVYHPLFVLRGSAQKEISDGLLICGDQGAILQVKSRGRSVANNDDHSSAVRWATREIRSAVRQARWSRKELARHVRDHGRAVLRPVRSSELPPDRVHELDFDFSDDPSQWPLVIVLDHPNLPSFHDSLDDDVIVITTQDWIGLMSAVRSIAGVLTYVNRCIENRVAFEPAIGDESRRFVAICEADSSTFDDGPTWGPWLSFAALRNPAAADMYQHVINRCWPIGSPLPAAPPADHRRIAEFLDEVPPSVRVSIGEKWREYGIATLEGGQASGISVMPSKAIFMLMHRSPSAELPPDAMSNRLAGIALVRAWELAPLGDRPLVAIGVFTHPGATDYIFVHVEGPAAPDNELKSIVDQDVGPLSLPDGIDRLRTW